MKSDIKLYNVTLCGHSGHFIWVVLYSRSSLLYHQKNKDMAKQKGPQFITGTIGGLTYYKLHGKYYVRKKSSLSRKRVKRSPAFRRTMEYAELLGQASKLAAALYRMLPRQQQQVERYREFTGRAMQLLKEGLDAAAVKARLSGARAAVTQAAAVRAVRPAPKPVTVRKHVPVFCTGRPVTRRRRGRRVIHAAVNPSRSVLPVPLPGNCCGQASSLPAPPGGKGLFRRAKDRHPVHPRE